MRVTRANIPAGSIDFVYAWFNEAADVLDLKGRSAPFCEGEPLYDDFYINKLPCVICEDVVNDPVCSSLNQKIGLRAFLFIPIYVEGGGLGEFVCG